LAGRVYHSPTIFDAIKEGRERFYRRSGREVLAFALAAIDSPLKKGMYLDQFQDKRRQGLGSFAAMRRKNMAKEPAN
jgi:hypothetical protein